MTEPVRGTSTFASDFEKTGVRDSKGRSLKGLDLKTRSLRFGEPPGLAKEVFYERAWTILSIDDRTAIREILQDTKPDFVRAPHK